MNPHAPETLKLCLGPLTLELAPHAGGAITAFRLQNCDKSINLMCPAGKQALLDSNASATSCFPLVPFSNRIENGEFEFRGKQIKLKLNAAPHPHAMHGQGFLHPWQLIDHGLSWAAIVYEHAGDDDGWPWIYRTEQHFKLDENKLTVNISLQNNSPETMPAGLGLHPYFPRTPGVQLDIALDKVWLSDETSLPTTLENIPEEWRLENNRTLDGITLNNCFTNWTGIARIYWPEFKTGLNITHDGLLQHMVIYVPLDQRFFCVEPVSHINNAIHLAARGIENTGLISLDPGQTISAELCYEVTKD